MRMVIHILALFYVCTLFFSCTTEADNAHYEALLDSARVEMLVNTDYKKAENIYKGIIASTRNKLIRLQADEGMMHLCQIRSLNKTYYDYRSDAQILINELKIVERHIDSRNLAILKKAKKDFYRISAVYYINLRDIDRTTEMLDSIKDKPLNKKEFLSIYLGKHSMYYQSLQKIWAAEELTDKGHYDEAIEQLSAALHIINLHHQKYSYSGLSDTLSIYSNQQSDSISTEMRWIQNSDCVSVPNWMAAVREQLSITFGAMGHKMASDYNHNIYLDILDATRQDLLLEQQLDSLQYHEHRLNIFLVITVVFSILLAIFGTRLYRRKRERSLLLQQQLKQEIEKNRNALLSQWLQQNGGSISQIQDEMEYADDERRAAEMKIEENKRSYIDKATSVSIANGIIPFLDRAIWEVEHDKDNIVYISELIDKINDYNDILGHWVKIKQGSVSLHIESFPLSSLFQVLQKAQPLYSSEGITLDVQPSDAVVKADKALTLFMINTLMDNARKFTPKGGNVSVYAEQTSEYVEISVKDTGYGMAEDDTRDVITTHKGHGFGLMNCKGIIEKYKKTNRLFSVCDFGVESQLGKGSRFFFRLPVKILTILLLILFPLFSFAAQNVEIPEGIRQAHVFSDSIYYCNTKGQYARAIEFGDSVLAALNMHYIATTGKTDKLLRLDGQLNDMPEILLWHDGFDTDYDVIISARNEIAIAALAMNRKHLYRYNCDVFTRLYKLISQDYSTADTVRRLERQNNNKVLILNLSVLMLFILIIIILLYYYHQYKLPLSNLRELQKLADRLLNTPAADIPDTISRAINDVITIDGIKIFPTGTSVIDRNNTTITFPLTVNTEGNTYDTGLLAVTLHSIPASSISRFTAYVLHMIASHLAIALYCTSTKIEELKQELELKQDEQHRAEADRNRIHVQNMILDNCLSAIKHETMYYPTRIKQLLQNDTGKSDMPNNIDTKSISELLHYYKEVFTVLSQCAMKQLEQTAFKRRIIPASEIISLIEQIKDKYKTTIEISAALHDSISSETRIVCDPVMLQYMLESLISSSDKEENNQTTLPTVSVSISLEGQFCQFAITDSRKCWNAEQISNLFYADSLKYNSETDQLIGSEYILCKQIIREHDDHCGVRGCKIYATQPNILTFTLPIQQTR